MLAGVADTFLTPKDNACVITFLSNLALVGIASLDNSEATTIAF